MHSAGMTGGVVIGQHQGLYNYTIGQRQGINVGGGGPYYVVKKDLKSNTLFVTHDAKDKALMIKGVDFHSLNWIAHVEARRGVPLPAATAIKASLATLAIRWIPRTIFIVWYSPNPKKLSPRAKSLVLYKGKECVGGGIINWP